MVLQYTCNTIIQLSTTTKDVMLSGKKMVKLSVIPNHYSMGR